MNKILIVGHPLSGYAEVETLLQACGMASAQPSRREGFMPAQISATLSKAHNVPALHQLSHGDDVKQTRPGPVWQGMALDLMLGNIDQPLWGWADPHAIHWLEYWRDLDPSLHFILAYDRPHSVLTRANEQDAATLSPETLRQRTRSWAAYNAALLHFFHRNPQRCLLVHSEQVRTSATSYLNAVRARIDAPWSDRLAQLADIDHHDSDNATQPASPNARSHDAPALRTVDAHTDEPLACFVAEALLRDHPRCLQLYEELQASAHLPLLADEASNRDATMALGAWGTLVAQRQQLQAQEDLAQTLETARAQAEAEAKERQRLQDDNQQMRADHEQRHQRTLADLAQVRDALDQTKSAAQRESELLLGQLLQVQTELERQQAEQQRLQLQATDVVAQAQGIAQQENDLLLSQLQQVQEELERHHLENQRLKQLAMPEKPFHYGAGDRVRDELSYRVGAVIVQRGSSLGGWVGMPWATRRVVRQYRREQPRRDARELPPIEAYRDAHDAERVRHHLSYRLGEIYQAHAATPLGWLRMPWALRREVLAFRSRRQND